MDVSNLTFQIEVKPLTPVYIGGASEKNWAKGIDFIYNEEDNKVYIINQEKFLSLLDEKQIQEYCLKLANGNVDDYTCNTLKHRNINISSISQYEFDVQYPIENDIKAFTRNGLGKPYIPGSSLKGAIRSALFHNLFNTNDYNRAAQNNNKLDRNEFVFGTITNNLMHFIQISDIEFNNTELFCSKIFNLFGPKEDLKGGWKHNRYGGTDSQFKEKGFTTTYEVLDLNDKGSGYIKFDKRLGDFINQNHNTLPRNFTQIFTNNYLSDFCNLINQYTNTHLEREIKFFQEYSNNETDNIISELKSIKTKIEKLSSTNSFIIRMGGGSGFHAITGDWQHEQHLINHIRTFNGRTRGQNNGKDSAKSRTIAFADFEEGGQRFLPFGFVKIKINNS